MLFSCNHIMWNYELYNVIRAGAKNILYLDLFYWICCNDLITRPLVGKIFDEKGHAVVILPGSICLIIGLITLSYANSILMLILSSLFYGLGYGAVQPSLQAWAVNRSPSNRQGAANGTFLSSMDLSYTLGSILLSFIAEHKSYAIMYRFSAIFIILLLLIYSYYVFIDNSEEPEIIEEKLS